MTTKKPLIIKINNVEYVRIYADGRAVIPKGISLDDASMAFWAAVYELMNTNDHDIASIPDDEYFNA